MTKPRADHTVPAHVNSTAAADIMSADEVARMLRLNRKTVYEAAARGILPCRRIGRRCLFFRPAIVAWLNEQRTGARAA